MILHELRFKPMRLWIVLYGLLGGCQVHESVWNDDLEVEVSRGTAVIPWEDAQLVTRADAEASDAGSELDAALDAALDAEADSSTGQRCDFRVTSLPLGGEYAPKNIGAIWIERGDGTWVKTLKVWAGIRGRYLTAYRSANKSLNKVDAVTSPTLRAFTGHLVGWNLSDVDGQEVPDGEYRVQVEVTDRDGKGETVTVPFTKTTPPFTSSVPDSEYFTDAELRCR